MEIIKNTLFNSSCFKYFYIFVINKLNMNFKDFDRDVAKEFGMSIKQARKILTYINRDMTHKIVFGHPVTFRDIGTLHTRVRESTKFFNLQEGKNQMTKKSYYLDIRVPDKMKLRLKHKIIY